METTGSGRVATKHKQKSKFREYTEALLTALVVALLLRSFVVEAFKVPSASMVPTILIGDHLFVNKAAFGLRVPLTKYWMVHFDEPERGEVVVFIYPVDEGKDFIKRVIGLPGDHILIKGRSLIINGEEVVHLPATATEENGVLTLVATDAQGKAYHFEIQTDELWENFDYFVEVIDGHPHVVQYHKRAVARPVEVTVPEGHFFAMGDNRDRSSDSREWGFVPEENLKGRALFVWLSLNYDHFGVRWDRFGHWIE